MSLEEKMDNKQLAEKYELEQDHFWKHNQSGKWIVSHRAVMKIAEVEGVVFHKPEIIREGMTSIVLYGEATLNERTIWSFGEAMPENCRMPYFWAMAEKRLKDRLTLTLIDVYGEIYSEIEADEFAAQNPNAGFKAQSEHGPPTEKQRKYCVRLIEEKIPDEEKKKWFVEFDAAEDTWAMSMIIDRLKDKKDIK
jgi:hypothetical protein